jgi:hypothetical protein
MKIQPPKYKSCGKAEWDHLCGPAANVRSKVTRTEAKIVRTPVETVTQDVPVDPVKSKSDYKTEWQRKRREALKVQKPPKPRGRPKKGELVAPLVD